MAADPLDGDVRRLRFSGRGGSNGDPIGYSPVRSEDMTDPAVTLTPLDIRKQEFRKRLRGYDTAGVEAFRIRGADGRDRAPVSTVRRRFSRAPRAPARRASGTRRPKMTGVAVADAVRAVQSRTAIVPEVAVILGTGLGALADELHTEATIPYPEIPGFRAPTVETHAGRLLVGTIGKRRVAIMQGRFHRYEGYTLQQVAFPVRVLRTLGAKTLIVS